MTCQVISQVFELVTRATRFKALDQAVADSPLDRPKKRVAGAVVEALQISNDDKEISSDTNMFNLRSF